MSLSSRRAWRRVSAAAAAAAGGAVVASLPRWLPGRVVALRMWVFARMNEEEGIPVPGPLVDASRFKEVYSHPAANGRSRGAALSDLFWYWLSPGPEIHQEHLEPGERYEEVARTTRRIVSLPSERIEDLATRYTAETCIDLEAQGRSRGSAGPMHRVRLRDLMMPIWAGFFSEVVFGRPCPEPTRALVVANADDVVTALKCCSLRHMDRRARLTRFLLDHVDEVPHTLPEGLSRPEQALYLQGTFFNTAVVQMSEAMTHLLMVLAQHRDLQAELATRPRERGLLDHVVDETMRLYPLFGIAHRITSDDIAVDDRTTLPAGSVLCFNYPDFHRVGFDDPDRFDPSRWDGLSAKEANHIPFGAPANRPCPAWHLAPIAMRAATRETLRHFDLHSSAGHTRSIPNRGPCLLVPRRWEPRPAQGLQGSRRSHLAEPQGDGRPAARSPRPTDPGTLALPPGPQDQDAGDQVPAHGPHPQRPPPGAPHVQGSSIAPPGRSDGRLLKPSPGGSPSRTDAGDCDIPGSRPSLPGQQLQPYGAWDARPWQLGPALAFLRFRDRWEDVWRSVVQLVLGSYMVWDARQQRLCQRHFEGNPTRTATAPRPNEPTPPTSSQPAGRRHE